MTTIIPEVFIIMSAMTVAVDPALKTIAAQLRELGYNVVTYGKYNYPIDALVYIGESLAAYKVTGSNTAGGVGVLMINAQNKTIRQIDTALKNKTYTPLF